MSWLSTRAVQWCSGLHRHLTATGILVWIQTRAFLCGVSMFSPGMCGCSPGTPASSHPKTRILVYCTVYMVFTLSRIFPFPSYRLIDLITSLEDAGFICNGSICRKLKKRYNLPSKQNADKGLKCISSKVKRKNLNNRKKTERGRNDKEKKRKERAFTL